MRIVTKYTVQSGDTLDQIARLHNMTQHEILNLNMNVLAQWANGGNGLCAGDVLRVYEIGHETVESVYAWQKATFGSSSFTAMLERAEKEMRELRETFDDGYLPELIAHEAADVVICLYRLIGSINPKAIDEKMAINRLRQWKVGPDGNAQHVEGT